MRHVLLAPHVTEKTALNEANGVYTFKVHATATKPEVEEAFRSLFGKDIEIKKVNITNVREKVRQIGRGRTLRKRQGFKKASIYLKDPTAHIDLAKVA